MDVRTLKAVPEGQELTIDYEYEAAHDFCCRCNNTKFCRYIHRAEEPWLQLTRMSFNTVPLFERKKAAAVLVLQSAMRFPYEREKRLQPLTGRFNVQQAADLFCVEKIAEVDKFAKRFRKTFNLVSFSNAKTRKLTGLKFECEKMESFFHGFVHELRKLPVKELKWDVVFSKAETRNEMIFKKIKKNFKRELQDYLERQGLKGGLRSSFFTEQRGSEHEDKLKYPFLIPKLD